MRQGLEAIFTMVNEIQDVPEYGTVWVDNIY